MHRPCVQGVLDLPAELGRVQRLRRDLKAAVAAGGPHHVKRLGQVGRVEQENVTSGATVGVVHADHDRV